MIGCRALRLREINQGQWEGQFAEDIRTRNDEHWEQRKSDPIHFRPPGGESVTEVAERVQAAMNQIAALYPTGHILIVSHGLALATIICREKGIPLGKAFTFIPENAVPDLGGLEGLTGTMPGLQPLEADGVDLTKI